MRRDSRSATAMGQIRRDAAYNWRPVHQRQVGWAHLKRDFTQIAERCGVSQAIGTALLARQRRLFRWWHRVRDGTMTREQFVKAVAHLRAGFKAELESACALPRLGWAKRLP